MTYSYPAVQQTSVRRNGLDFTALFVLLLSLLLVASVALWQVWHVNRIFTGVNVAGVPVGGLTRAVALAKLQRSLSAATLPPVNLAYGERQWSLDPIQVQARPNLLESVNQAYLVGRSGEAGNQLLDQLVAVLGGANVTPRLSYQTEMLRSAISEVANQLNRPPRAQEQMGAISVPAQIGVTVDEAATLAHVVAALDAAPAGLPLRVALSVKESTAPAASSVAPAPILEQTMLAPLILSDDQFDIQLALDPSALNNMLVSIEPRRADDARLRELVESYATQIDRPGRDARLRFNPDTGAVLVTQESLSGRKLDVEATVAAIQQALATGSDQAQLEVNEIAPLVDGERVAEMGIRELVASGSTYFAGSSADRIRNVEVAAEKFDGVVIPPGEIFSFNKIVQDVSAANGFEDSLVIWGDRTAVGVGGGVCQVSTTVFRTAYLGGFPIVERYNHGYVVGWYGKPGLDATIFTPSVDFRFRNDTNAYLLLQPYVDSVNGVMTFNFYGTRPDRQVTVSEPVISDVKKAPEPLYTLDESLAEGQQKQMETAKDGMTVTVERTIIENGTTRTEKLVSNYQPWRAVYLVGPGVEIPQPVVEEEAAPEVQTTP